MAGSPICMCGKVTSECSIHPHGKKKWIVSMQAGLVKTLVWLGLGKGLKVKKVVYGQRSSVFLASFDHSTCFWKTVQQSFIEDSTLSLKTLPNWGIMLSGRLYRLPPLVHHTDAQDGGVWPFWQTPLADDAANRKHGKWNSRGEPKLSAQVKMWPTPNARDYKGPPGKGAQMRGGRRSSLPAVVKYWPTPTYSDYKGRGPKSKQQGLSEVVKYWPTPTATSHKGWSKGHKRANKDDRLDYTVEREAHQTGNGGRLNPTWVEWLMGWPIEWTELKR